MYAPANAENSLPSLNPAYMYICHAKQDVQMAGMNVRPTLSYRMRN